MSVLLGRHLVNIGVRIPKLPDLSHCRAGSVEALKATSTMYEVWQEFKQNCFEFFKVIVMDLFLCKLQCRRGGSRLHDNSYRVSKKVPFKQGPLDVLQCCATQGKLRLSKRRLAARAAPQPNLTITQANDTSHRLVRGTCFGFTYWLCLETQ
eukprot:3352864-Amphidinium_carterae.1